MTPQGDPRRNGGRRTTVAVLAVLALAGAALLAFALSSQVAAPPQPELRSQGAASDGGGTGPAGSGRTDGLDAGTDPATVPGPGASEPSAQPTSQAPDASGSAALPASEPTSLRIDSIGVDQRVFPIGLGQDGALLAPRGEQADLAAWFEGSPTPGEAGPSVIEGHVTWGGDPSVFFELGALAPGDRVEVDREDGTTATFEVYDSARYPKDEFPTVAVYGRTDGPELRLITCAGDLDEDGHHLDNTVVFARLIEN
ncbi:MULTISPECIES: class F sortase [Brachybacterium]|uniref:class F sortase n=1 Tax=Brachybacterium TaxID=43668 RepID=UPI0006B617B0|nr:MULTISPECIES: class F sortase [Brachybacterium]GAP80484.1 putative secreted protein [Brachybacterium sp. SW0106-09]